jgi:nitrile hydratase
LTVSIPHNRQFRDGERVRVIHLGIQGHVRVPFYVRGKIGEVVNYCGSYLNPENLATGRANGPAVDLYRVKFIQRELWGCEELPSHDCLIIEIYDHWLVHAENDERNF